MPDDGPLQPSLADEMEREATRLDTERKDAEDQQQKALLEASVSNVQQQMDDKPIADRDIGEFEQKLDAEVQKREGTEFPVSTPDDITPDDIETVIDLDHTQEQQAASVVLTEVSDIIGGDKSPLKISDFQEDQQKDCGLPDILMDKKNLIAYLMLHSVTGKMRRVIEYTVTERNCYDRYQKQIGESQAVGKDHFTAALRMFKAGLPMSPASEMNLNAMKVS